MTDVTVDAELRAKLGNLDRLLRVHDESGRILGYFHPVAVADLSEYQNLDPPISDEELQRRRQVRTGRPLAEILARLEQL